jgi:hypothetical protein
MNQKTTPSSMVEMVADAYAEHICPSSAPPPKSSTFDAKVSIQYPSHKADWMPQCSMFDTNDLLFLHKRNLKTTFKIFIFRIEDKD